MLKLQNTFSAPYDGCGACLVLKHSKGCNLIVFGPLKYSNTMQCLFLSFSQTSLFLLQSQLINKLKRLQMVKDKSRNVNNALPYVKNTSPVIANDI